MIKTILALAVTAAAYLIASDAGAATTTLDLDFNDRPMRAY